MSTIEFRYDGTLIPDVQWASANFESQMGAIPGTFEVTIKDTEQTYSFVTGKHVTLTIDASKYFGGIVTQVTRKLALPVDDTVTDGASGVKTRQWVLRGVDYNIWFDKRFLYNRATPTDGIPEITGEPTDKQVIKYIFEHLVDIDDTSIDYQTYVDNTGEDVNPDGSTYLPAEQPGDALRKAMDFIREWTGAIYYFDHSQFLHYHSQETVTPAWSFSDTPNNTTTFGFREFEFTEDGSNVVNDALVWGGTAYTASGATGVLRFGRYTNSTSLGARGRWQMAEAHFNTNGFGTNNGCATRARVIVEGRFTAGPAGLDDDTQGLVNPQKQIRMVWFSGTTPTPLIPGSVVTTAMNTFGLTVALPVRQIRISFVTPSEARFEGFFGIQTGDPWTLWKYMRKVQDRIDAGIPAEPLTLSDGTSTAPDGSLVATTPTPAPNGSAVTFTVPDIFVAGSTKVYMNGLLQRRGLEYFETPTSSTITFYTAPLTGDDLWVEYVSGG